MKMEAEEDQRLTRYLLGELPEGEQIQIENRAFEDQQFLARLQDAENDLMDEYARGELTVDERARFERLFLASPGRRERVELARDLALNEMDFADQTTSRRAIPLTTRERLPFLEFMRARRPVFGYTLAAFAALIIGGGLWMIWQNLRPHAEDLAHVPVNQQTQQSNDVRQAEGDPSQPSPTASPTPTRQGERDKTNETGTPRSTVVTFVLLPVTRDSGNQVKELAVPRESQVVQLRLELERRERATHFTAELRRSGTKVWRRGNLSARLTDKGETIVLSVPANILPEGEYEVALSGATPEGLKSIGFYYFTISRN